MAKTLASQAKNGGSIPLARSMRSLLLGLFAALLMAAPATAKPDVPTLEGRAVLPAETFAPGPVSGTLIGPGPFNGITPPFAGQPVQGFSAVLDAGRGDYWAMPDNGYGAEENSKDFLLRVYRIDPDFETARGGSGTIDVEGFISLRDPDGHVPFALERSDRLLTGGDFDIESMRIDRRGDLWFGDEFGPWLLHTDRSGRVLEPPVDLPGVKSPQNPPVAPFNPAPTLGRSLGFEGMAISPNGRTLYPMLEGALTADPDQTRRFIHEYRIGSGYTGRRRQYRVEVAGNAIGDFTQLDRNRFVVIERDNFQGAAAQFKKIYLVDFRRVDRDGFLVKREVVDLLHIADPHEISLPAVAGDIGLGEDFAFPFQTIEDVLPLRGGRLLVLDDNNFPFSNGRHPGQADPNEAIVIRVPGLRGGDDDSDDDD
jgi:hypothetical protein